MSGLVQEKSIRIKRGITSKISFRLGRPSIDLASSPDIAKDLYDLAERASESLYIISPFLTRKPFEKVINKVGKSVKIKVIVRSRESYFQAVNAAKSSSRKTEIKLRGRVHCKIFANENEAIVSSLNITGLGLGRQNEVGVIANCPEIVDCAKSLFWRFWNGSSVYREKKVFKNDVSSSLPSVFVSSIINLPLLVLDLVRKAEKTVVLVTPYLDLESVRTLLDDIKADVEIATITKLNMNDWKIQMSEPDAIQVLLKRGRVYSNARLHGKVIIVDDKHLLISSMNLTNKGFWYNYEAGVYTQDPQLVGDALQLVQRLKGTKVCLEDFLPLRERFVESFAPIQAAGVQVAERVHEKFAYPAHAAYSVRRKRSSVRMWVKHKLTCKPLTHYKVSTHRKIPLQIKIKNVSSSEIKDVRLIAPSSTIIPQEVGAMNKLSPSEEVIFEDSAWYTPLREGTHTIEFILCYSDLRKRHNEIRLLKVPVYKMISPRQAIVICLRIFLIKSLKEQHGKATKDELLLAIRQYEGRGIPDSEFVLCYMPELRSEIKLIEQKPVPSDSYYSKLLEMGLKTLELNRVVEINHFVKLIS